MSKKRRRVPAPQREPDAIVTIDRGPGGALSFGVRWYDLAARQLFEESAASCAMTIDAVLRPMAQMLWQTGGEGEYAMQADDLRALAGPVVS